MTIIMKKVFVGVMIVRQKGDKEELEEVKCSNDNNKEVSVRWCNGSKTKRR